MWLKDQELKDPYSWITLAPYHNAMEKYRWETEVCYQNQAYTAFQVMVGSVLECVLAYALTHIRVPVSENASLDELIKLAQKHSLLPQGDAYLGQGIRDYRNLVHPLKQIREEREVTKETAEVTKKAVEYVISEIKKHIRGYIPPSVSAHLLVEGKEIPILQTPFTLGRREDNSYTLTFNNVSKKHAQITFYNSRFYLEDLGSTNGTYIFIEKGKVQKLRINRPYLLACSTTFRLGKEDEDPKLTLWIEGEELTGQPQI